MILNLLLSALCIVLAGFVYVIRKEILTLKIRNNQLSALVEATARGGEISAKELDLLSTIAMDGGAKVEALSEQVARNSLHMAEMRRLIDSLAETVNPKKTL